MNDISSSKYLSKKKIKEPLTYNKYFVGLFVRSVITVVVLLITLIICKSNAVVKDSIYKYVYNTNFSFTTINNWYNKYLGGIIPLDKLIGRLEPVFNENLKYSDASKYLDGVKLTVNNNYLVPIVESGIVVYVGEKEGYGNTIIIQGMDGIDIWYGNMESISVKIYDYVEKGNLLGETKDNYLYLVYSKNSEFLNYEEYLK